MAEIEVKVDEVRAAIAAMETAIEEYKIAISDFKGCTGCLDEMNSDFVGQMKVYLGEIAKKDSEELLIAVNKYKKDVEYFVNTFESKDSDLANSLRQGDDVFRNGNITGIDANTNTFGNGLDY